MDDVVAPSWKLDDFRRSPVIMHAHDYEGPVVGKAVEIDLVGDTLMMRVQFDEHESNPLGQRLANQYREGFMSAFSVGFAPGKVTPRSQLPKDHPAYSEKSAGSLMEENSLLEVSAVAIGANQHALAVRAKRWGLDPEAVKMPLPPASMAPNAKHILNVEETEDTYTITYAKTAQEAPEAEGYNEEEEDDDRTLRSVVRDELLALFADSKEEEIQDGLELFFNDSTPADEPDSFEALFTQGE
tara:strand:- start:220 stop:945 length:726 start_codon:yes stop_codon:yes gene_type:complete